MNPNWRDDLRQTDTPFGRILSMTRQPSIAFCAICALFTLAGTVGAESPAQRDSRMAWWREARFGMFVHYGTYSGLAGTWNGRAVSGDSAWLQSKARLDSKTYADKSLPLFKPASGFAEQWVNLAKEAGCKYLVFTTKHHEGFALHDSKVSQFDAGSSLQRDLAREIVDAARAQGLRVGFYYSLIDWHHPEYDFRQARGLSYPGHPGLNDLPQRDHTKYIEFLHAQVDELMSNYGPIDVLWWDYSSTQFQGDQAWRSTELMQKVRARQPAIIMNNRLYRSLEAGWTGMGQDAFAARLDPKFGDFITPEQHVPDTGITNVDWETCMTMNKSWGYNENDHAWKSNETLIRHLVDIASKGGNFLLNIGPKADGSIPEPSVLSMRAIGEWMKVNGEAIYGTTASPWEKPAWGRCTQKPGKLYLHVFEWPEKELLVPPVDLKVAHAYLLSDPEKKPLSFSQVSDGIRISLPKSAPDEIASVIVLSSEKPDVP